VTNWRDSQIRPGTVRLCLLLLTILLLVTGCGGTPTAGLDQTNQTPPPATQPLPATDEPGTPEGEAMQSPLSPPAVELPWDAAPAEGKAIVRGQIEVLEPGVLLGELFLASAVPTTNPEVDLLELDHDNSPSALLDRTTGRFMFLNVEPGKYGLVVWEPMSSAPVPDPETGETLFFEFSAGEVKDLGTLRFP
jgi:hypothetical protein